MANFSTTEFIFNNVSCYEFGLQLASSGFNGEGENLLQSVDMRTVRPSHRPYVYTYGVMNMEEMSFDMEFYRETPIYSDEKGYILSWLNNNGQYGDLTIKQLDMFDKHFRCYFKEIKSVTYGNFCYGFKCNVVCDSPYCYGDDISYIYKSAKGKLVVPNVSSSFIPTPIKMEITVKSGTEVNIKNETTNENMSIDSLANDDVIYVDSSLQRIYLKNNETKNMVDHFTGDFINLLGGNNTFNVLSGDIDLRIMYTPEYIIGG